MSAEYEHNWQEKALDIVMDTIKNSHVMTYNELALAANIHPPHRIHKLTNWLELLMEEDAKERRPFRAAVIISKTNHLPAKGFFTKAAEIGYDDIGVHSEQIDWHRAYLNRLYSYYL